MLRTMRALTEKHGGQFELPPPVETLAPGSEPSDEELLGTLKSEDRILEKMASDYNGIAQFVVDAVRASADPAAALQPLFDAISPTASSDAPPAERDPKVAAESAKCLVEVVAAFGPLTGLPLKALAGNRVSRSRMN